ncbi:restriction endonuclease [Streptomyces sp. HUCO-GS316]|uniref:restriction endonuclease n=1 Tax=Streptomyces sp. HUCO-GS316 TaxID=2692198 RepID=UPI001F2282D7|nr:restriction endonuclease [Streptomyces sp. HUCO-GS316]
MQPMQVSSWQQAELNAARWMRHWGYADATARPGGPDSGVDVRAAGALGQVKYQAAQVGRPELQRFVGARPRGSNAQLIFFTGSDYAPTAVAYAEEWSIALFKYGLDGMMTPVNAPARLPRLPPRLPPHPPRQVSRSGSGTGAWSPGSVCSWHRSARSGTRRPTRARSPWTS